MKLTRRIADEKCFRHASGYEIPAKAEMIIVTASRFAAFTQILPLTFLVGCTSTTLVSKDAPMDSNSIKAIEVCFSPDEKCDDKLLDFIDSATVNIDIAIYDINLEKFVQHLRTISPKVRVRIVVDRRQSNEKHSAVQLLINEGIEVRYGHQRGIMHDKFCIVDNKMVETGSFNYTNHAATANKENQIYTSNLEIVGKFQREFMKIWDTGVPVSK